MDFSDLLQERGAIPLDLGRPRIVFFGMRGTWLLIQRYGNQFLPELYKHVEGSKSWGQLELQSMDALQYFLWAGLQEHAGIVDEPFTMADAEKQIRPFTYTRIFQSVVMGLVATQLAPALPGKSSTASASAKPAVAAPPTPGPTRVSTSSKRSASRSGSSAGRRRGSGR